MASGANTESNEWFMVNEPPGRPLRPAPPPAAAAAGESFEPDQALLLLQPVLPTALRYDPGDAAEGDDPPKAATTAAHDSPTVEAGAATKADGGSGETDLARDGGTEGEQPPDGVLGHETRSAARTGAESKPVEPDKEREKEDPAIGGDVLAPLKIESAELFASLSSSTAGVVTISSKSMARVGGENVSPTSGALAGARQGEGSSSTFALSSDADDEDGAAAVPARNDASKVAQRSPASLDVEAPPKNEVAARRTEAGDVSSSTPGKPSSASPASPSAEHGDGGVSAETSRRSAASPSSGGAGNVDGVPAGGTRSRPSPSPRAATMPSPQAERSLARRSIETGPAASAEDTKKRPPSQRDSQVVDEESGERAPSTEPSGYARPTPSPLGEAAAEESATEAEGDLAVHGGAESDGSTHPDRLEDGGGAATAGHQEEGSTASGGRDTAIGGRAGHASLGEENQLAGGSGAHEQDGSVVGALEERSLVGSGSGSSHSSSGSVLDVGGGGVDVGGGGDDDDDDDDDGYF